VDVRSGPPPPTLEPVPPTEEPVRPTPEPVGPTPEPVTPTPEPVIPTPEPPPAPLPPEVQNFGVTPGNIEPGQCVMASWTTGGGTTRVQLLRDGAVILDNAQLNNSVQDCPPQGASSTIRYTLIAYNNVGQQDARDAAVQVASAPPPPPTEPPPPPPTEPPPPPPTEPPPPPPTEPPPVPPTEPTPASP